MKFSENQSQHYEKTVMLGDEIMSPFEHILYEITSKVMGVSDQIWTDDYGLGDLVLGEDERDQHIEKAVD